jgi:glycosyltransferase 2 family protein
MLSSASPNSRMHVFKSWLIFAVKLIFTVGILVTVFRHIHFEDMWSRVRYLSVGDFVILFCFMLAQLILNIYRWQSVLGYLDAKPHWLAVTRGMFLERFVNIAVPSFVGGDAGRLLEIRQAGVSFKAALKSVVIDRALAITGLLILMLITLPSTLHIVTAPNMRVGIGVVLGAPAVALAMLLVLPERFWNISTRIVAVKRVTAFAALIHSLLRSWHFNIAGVWTSVAIQAVVAIMVAVLAWDLHIPFKMGDAFALIPIVTLIGMAPLAVAGWGFREGAMVVLLGLVGIGRTDALALSVIQGVATVIFGGVAGLAWVLFPKSPKECTIPNKATVRSDN